MRTKHIDVLFRWCSLYIIGFQNAAIMDVVFGHPLHPLHTFSDGLPLGDKEVTSRKRRTRICTSSFLNNAAEALLSNPILQWQAAIINDKLLKLVPEPNVNVVLKSVEIMEAIVMNQV